MVENCMSGRQRLQLDRESEEAVFFRKSEDALSSDLGGIIPG
jgi:hypothetical protein